MSRVFGDFEKLRAYKDETFVHTNGFGQMLFMTVQPPWPSEVIKPPPPPPPPLISSTSLAQSVEKRKLLHKRPMSNLEFEQLMNILESQGMVGGTRGLYYAHEQSAIAQVIYENMKVFSRDTIIPPIVVELYGKILEIENPLVPEYEAALKEFSAPLFDKTIEQARNLYTVQERLRFGSHGLAFIEEYLAKEEQEEEKQRLIDEAKSVQEQKEAGEIAAAEIVAAQDVISEKKIPSLNDIGLTYSHYVHPMLQFGLIPKKNNSKLSVPTIPNAKIQRAPEPIKQAPQAPIKIAEAPTKIIERPKGFSIYF